MTESVEQSSETEIAEDQAGQEPTAGQTGECTDEVAALRLEVAALKEQVLRAMADADNIRKRARRDVEEAGKYAVTAFARDLVNVAENLQRTIDSIPTEQRAGDAALRSLAEGVELTLKELLSAFEKHGIRRIDPLGEKFDHNYHQAVVQIDSPDHEAGTIVQVLQAGYTIHDRLLRPAMVGVAKQGEPQKKVDTTA